MPYRCNNSDEKRKQVQLDENKYFYYMNIKKAETHPARQNGFS